MEQAKEALIALGSVLASTSASIVSSLHRCQLTLTFVALLSVGALHIHAQDVTEVALKGAFIFNFARFTEWPHDALPPSAEMSACVVGDAGVADALGRAAAASRRRLNGRSLRVIPIASADALPPCHLLYMSGLARVQMEEIVLRLRDTAVLTVSDDAAFIKAGGIIQIFHESGRVRFRINPRSATRARLQLSAKLLALADVVDEELRPVLIRPQAQYQHE